MRNTKKKLAKINTKNLKKHAPKLPKITVRRRAKSYALVGIVIAGASLVERLITVLAKRGERKGQRAVKRAPRVHMRSKKITVRYPTLRKKRGIFGR